MNVHCKSIPKEEKHKKNSTKKIKPTKERKKQTKTITKILTYPFLIIMRAA